MSPYLLITCFAFLVLPRPSQSYCRINKSKSCQLCDEELDSCMQKSRYPIQILVCVECKKDCMRKCLISDDKSQVDQKNGRDDIENYIGGGYWNSDHQVDNKTRKSF